MPPPLLFLRSAPAVAPASLPDLEQPLLQIFIIVWIVLIAGGVGWLWYLVLVEGRDRRRMVPVASLAPPQIVIRSDRCPFCNHPVRPGMTICPFCRESIPL